MVRHFCIALGLLSVLNSNASEAPYPEVFDEFITGWVDYDDGYYAAALRAFARAYALDPEFRPATEAMAASLGHMGMSEIGESILRDRWVSKGSEYTYRSAIAFWGIFHSAEINSVSTAGLEQTVTDSLGTLVDLPVVLTSPSAKTWVERKNLQPCAYNLLIFLFKEAGHEHAIARIHLIRNYSIESGKELDLTLSALLTRYRHQSVEINLDANEIAQLASNAAFHNGLRELFDPDVVMENPAYRIDAVTEASSTSVSVDDPWESIIQASLSTEFALENYHAIKQLYRRHRGNGPVMAAVGPGLPEWLAHQLETNHPMRPWLLAEADRENLNDQRWNPNKAAKIREELIQDHPEDVATTVMLFDRQVWGMHHLNYEERMTLILEHLPKLKALPEDFFQHPDAQEDLERFERTVRACLGEPVEEAFLPYIIHRVRLRMAENGRFRLDFGGRAPMLLKHPIQNIDNHDQFAMEALIDLMFNITDTEVLLDTYKAHVDRNDALGSYLRRIKNGVMWRLKWGPKENYAEACQWWIQRAIHLIESGANWKEVATTLPSYTAFSEHNQPLLEAINRSLEQRGLPPLDENVSLANSCPRKWKISFQDLSRKSQDAVLQYHRNQAANDFESYLTLLAWLNWSDAKELFRAEARHAWKDYMLALRTTSDHRKRIQLAHNYMQVLIPAGEAKLALDAGSHVSADAVALKKLAERSDSKLIYQLRTARVKALVGTGRFEEAREEIDRMLQELDGQLVSYSERYIISERKNPGSISLLSVLLKLKDEMLNKTM